MQDKTRRRLMPLFFLAPFAIVFVIFMLYPVLYSVFISFMRFKAGEFTFNGLKNFSFLLTDPLFYKSLRNTLIVLVLEVPIQTFLALVLASMLNARRLRGKGLFRMIVFMPVLIDTVCYAIVFGLFFNTEGGFVNSALRAIGFAGPDWLNDAWLAKVVIVLAMLWRWTGYNTVIILGGLQNIDGQLYEAAAIDGASRIRQFFAVTLPGVKQVLMFSVIMSVNGALQLFTEPFLLTRGGPTNETLTIVQYLYQTGFKSFNFGVAAAGSYILAIFIGVVTFVQMRVTREDE